MRDCHMCHCIIYTSDSQKDKGISPWCFYVDCDCNDGWSNFQCCQYSGQYEACRYESDSTGGMGLCLFFYTESAAVFIIGIRRYAGSE